MRSQFHCCEFGPDVMIMTVLSASLSEYKTSLTYFLHGVQVFVATAPGPLPSGEYWADCNLAAATAAAHDADLGRALWEGSENVVAQFVGEAKGMAGNGKGLQSGIRWGGVSS